MKDGWIIRPLGDLCSIRPSKSEAKVRLKDSDLVSFLPMEDLDIDNKRPVPRATRALMDVEGSYTYFADGDVLLAKITPCFENGKLGIATGLTNGCGFGSSEFFVIRPTAILDTEYLYYFLSRASFRVEGARSMGGAVGHQRVTKEFIESYPVPVPPLPEQQRIVAILDEAFEGLALAAANAEKNLKNARELFDGYLDSVFSATGSGWVRTKLGKEIDLLTGFAFKSGGYTEADDSVYLLRGDNIVQGTLRWQDVKKWPVSDVERYAKFLLHADDVVIAMDRTWVKSGIKYAVIQEQDLPCLLLQRVARLRALPRLDTEFLQFLIASPQFSKYVLSIQTGLGVPHISGPQIEGFDFHMPTRNEQRRICAVLGSLTMNISQLTETYQKKLGSLVKLKQSLLSKAFAGDLT